ncbi:MAG: hypothetical protein ACYS9X_21795 [Planctomycetota bacterium]|jgi:hypothetical protein
MHTAAKTGLVSAAFALLVAVGCDDDDPAPPPAPPKVDVTGTWEVVVDYGGIPLIYTGALVMAPDGAVTGTVGGDAVTGRVSGYGINLTVNHGSGYLTYLSGIVDASETSADGTWSDTGGAGGDWVATRL